MEERRVRKEWDEVMKKKQKSGSSRRVENGLRERMMGMGMEDERG